MASNAQLRDKHRKNYLECKAKRAKRGKKAWPEDRSKGPFTTNCKRDYEQWQKYRKLAERDAAPIRKVQQVVEDLQHQVAVQSLDPNRCNAMTGAHLQVACREARKVGRGFTAADLNAWMAEVGFDWRTNTFAQSQTPTLAPPQTSHPGGFQPSTPSDVMVGTSDLPFDEEPSALEWFTEPVSDAIPIPRWAAGVGTLLGLGLTIRLVRGG